MNLSSHRKISPLERNRPNDTRARCHFHERTTWFAAFHEDGDKSSIRDVPLERNRPAGIFAARPEKGRLSRSVLELSQTRFHVR